LKLKIVKRYRQKSIHLAGCCPAFNKGRFFPYFQFSFVATHPFHTEQWQLGLITDQLPHRQLVTVSLYSHHHHKNKITPSTVSRSLQFALPPRYFSTRLRPASRPKAATDLQPMLPSAWQPWKAGSSMAHGETVNSCWELSRCSSPLHLAHLHCPDSYLHLAYMSCDSTPRP